LKRRYFKSLALALTLTASTTISISPVAAADTQIFSHIDWAGVNLTLNTSLFQSVKPLNVPPLSSGQVDWSLYMGNNRQALWPSFTLSNTGRAMFVFSDVPEGSKVENVGSATCRLTDGNAFLDPNTWRSTCTAPLIPVAGETYSFSIKPIKLNNSQWWEGSVKIESTGEVVQLGRIENNPSQATLSGSQNSSGYNQISLYKQPLPACSEMPDFSAVFSALKTSTGSTPVVSGTRLSQTCPGLSEIDSKSSPGSYKVNMGNIGKGKEVVSDPLRGHQLGSYYASNIRPSSGGSPITSLCKTGKVVTQISIAPETPSGFVPGFRFGCAILNSDGSVDPVTDIYEIVNQGVQESDYRSYWCGPKRAVTGITAATLKYVRDVAITCSEPIPYSLGTNQIVGIRSSLPLNAMSICRESSTDTAFVTGFSAYAAAGLDAIQAICTPYYLKGSTPTQSTNNSKSERPSFSLVNFTGNKVSINVDLGSGTNKPDQIYLVSPRIGATEVKKIYGKISGNIATWSFSLSNLISGDLIPMKIVSLKKGIESDSLEENFTFPGFSSVAASKAVPVAPKNITSRVIGTSGIVTASATAKVGALAKSASLFGSSLGISPSKALEGEVIGTKVVFEIPIKSSMAGKTYLFYVFFENDAGKSDSVQGKISIPGLPKISTEGLTLPDRTIAGKTILCSKGSQTRSFVAKSCPPGWKKT
jgi:hypothetical protein